MPPPSPLTLPLYCRLVPAWMLCLWWAAVFSWLSPVANAALPGLTAAEAVTRYFNAKFPSSAAAIAGTPATLSATTLFSDLATLAPNPGLMPYGLNCPPWADGASARRWIAIPNDGVVNSASEKLTNSTAGDWTFPIGTVLVKHLDLPISDLQPTLTKKVETQILVLGSNSVWYAVTYRWREDESEADLLSFTSAVDRIFSIPTATGFRSQTWTYQPRAQCATCHSTTVGVVLGLHTPQLNGSLFYPKTGRTANQLWTLQSLGFLTTTLTEATIATLPKTVHVNDFTQSLENRARSYLEANCAFCHRPGLSAFDLRFSTAFSSQGILNAPTVTDYGIAGQGLIRPRSVSTSMIHYRANLLGATQMPPLGKTRIDTAGQLTLAEWINSLSGYEIQGPAGLQAKYYNATNFTILRTTQTDANIDFDWGTAAPAANTNADNFSVLWFGKILAPGTGTYTFSIDADDGVRLIVNNLSLVSDLAIHNPTRSTRTGIIALTAGNLYDFQLEYFDATGDAQCHLSWSGPNATGIIPASRFFQSSSTALPGPPLAVNDSATLLRGTSITLPVTTNDTDTEGNLVASTVSIYSAPSKGTAIKNANGTITYTSNFAAGGGTDQLLYTVGDATGKTSNRAAVFLTIQTDSGNWRNSYFTSGEQNLPTLGAWGADPDGDGQSNLLEYAANTDPLNAASRSQPIQTRISPTLLQLRYAKRPGADITYSIETASQTQGPWLSPDPTLNITENASDHLTVQLPLTAGRKFVRLRCVLLP